MAGVAFENVSKRYGSVSVIEDLNLEIADQEFMVLVGPSGCGKSTALRMIAGLEEISAGTIRIGDRVVNNLAPKDRDIAMVFQSYALYPHMSVRENLEFGLRMRKIPRSQMNAVVMDAARILGLENLLERRPRDLSGGQRQRVAVGRAIVRQPSVFLFDEPLSNLDAKLRVQMRAEITKLQQRLGTTCVYVTHDQIEAMTMGHRIAVMNAGKLQQVGAPLEVYEQPTNLFVANFIGTPPMNVIGATVVNGRLRADGFELSLPDKLRSSIRAGQVMIGIRPEHLQPARNRPAAISGTVEMIEPLGHQVIVYAKVGENLLVAALEAHEVPRVGQPIALEIDSNKLHLFDALTEQRISAR